MNGLVLLGGSAIMAALATAFALWPTPHGRDLVAPFCAGALMLGIMALASKD